LCFATIFSSSARQGFKAQRLEISAQRQEIANRRADRAAKIAQL